MKTKTKIETKTSLIGLVLLIGVLIVGIAVAAGSDDMLRKYEESGKQFETVEIGDTIVYFHQRMIDDAIVEGDYIDYQFDSNTKELKKKIIHWRSDLPEHMPPAPMITKEQAESMAKGKVQFTTLYIISPDSVVFPLKPTPKNPCWIVRSIDNGNLIVTIIDAVDGKMLGYGVPPPYTGFSLSGPVDIVNCTGVWTAWYQNASFWFNAMGYPTEAVVYPDEAKVQSHIQSNETAMFYELAHGGSYSFDNNCSDSTNAAEIHNWIENYTKMPFTFIGSCGGMCDLSPNTHSYEFRKCSSKDTVTVGYCGMGTPNCTNAWSNSVDWQDALFNYMNQSNTVKEAFDKAIADYPMCVDCMRFAGDENFAVVPVVERGDLTEVEKAIEKGLCWLHHNQNPDGSWSNNVGTTSLAALSFMNAGYIETDPDVQKAINYILSKVQPDGRITTGYDTYETSLATLALVATHNSSYNTTIENAANWLKDSQWDESCLWGNVDKDDWRYGGFGYGGSSRPDLSNSQFALMALDSVLNVSKDDLLWDKAQVFLARDQMRQANVSIPDINYTVAWNPSYNKYDDGGFVYYPGASISSTGTSYGSMTAAGIWSLRLSNVPTNNPRVQAALDWHKGHYTWTQNPGMSPDARRFQYYYYLAFSKALMMTVGNQTFDGHDWYADLSANLTALQHPDGHWVNTYTGHGGENDPNTVTSYSILALEIRKIPTNIQRLSWLTFILHSNADLHVYDPLGRHIGMNYDTGEIEIQIPNATYTSNGEQNITIPGLETGNYRIVLIGTGTGEYTLDVTGGVGADIVSEDSFTSTISEGEVHDANVNVAMITWLTIHVDEPEPTDAMVQSATGTGNVSFVSDSGTIEDLTALNESDLPEENTAIDFPHGLFGFNITGLSDGETVNVTIDFPQDIPTTTEYWKYHTPEGWYQIPMGSNDGDHIITIQLTDGGLGDDDGIANGVIVDQGGPGVSAMIPASIIIEPETLNLASQGVFTAYIQLPEDYNVSDINVSTVVCEGAPAVRGMVSEEDNTTYITKFNRQELVNVTIGDAVVLTVTGNLYDGTPFEGSDTIRVIDKGKGK